MQNRGDKCARHASVRGLCLLGLVLGVAGCTSQAELERQVNAAYSSGRSSGESSMHWEVTKAQQKTQEVLEASLREREALQAERRQEVASVREAEQLARQELADALNSQIDDLKQVRQQHEKRAFLLLLTQPALLLAVGLTIGGGVFWLLVRQRLRLRLEAERQQLLALLAEYERLRLELEQLGLPAAEVARLLPYCPSPLGASL